MNKLLLAIIALLTFTTLSQADDPRWCMRRGFPFCQGCATDVVASTYVNTICSIPMVYVGGTAGLQIVVRPAHGTYGSANSTDTLYSPKLGYVGDDYFEARIFYVLPDGKRSFTLMRVKMTVLAK